ncbi:MAG: flagellar basal body P-ring formation protein FlgA [Rubrivivax sp.]|nr:flagellar basal body P-ring formation protein FlgA [Rubrivivax sp.]
MPAVEPSPQEAQWAQQIDRWVTQAAQAALSDRPDVRIEVEPGRLDARLRLAPCERVDFHLPAGQKPWGLMRVGLRCVEGPVRWNVYMPVTVRVLAPAVRVKEVLAAGTSLQPEHLTLAEADWAATESPAFGRIDAVVGRSLARGLPAGATLRDADLKKRQWFAVGDAVRVVAVGRGFSVSADGVALSAGIDGQAVRVRTESGRTLSGIATGDRRVEVPL